MDPNRGMFVFLVGQCVESIVRVPKCHSVELLSRHYVVV